MARPKQPKVIAIGECMVELGQAGEGLLRQRFAGDAFNTAVYLKRTRPQVEVQFLTVTGSDPLSLAMRQAWADEGVHDGLAFADPSRRPALYLIETDETGDRRFHYWRGESAARGWLRALLSAGGADALADADLVYVSGISLGILGEDDRAAALAFFTGLARTTRLAFDPNLRPVLWPSLDVARETFEAMAGIAHILLPSRQDMQDFYGEADSRRQMERLATLGAPEIALTAEGNETLVLADGAVTGVMPPKADPVDTSGGGDSFNGGYLAARITGSAPVEAAGVGLALAARVVEQRGAIIPR